MKPISFYKSFKLKKCLKETDKFLKDTIGQYIKSFERYKKSPTKKGEGLCYISPL